MFILKLISFRIYESYLLIKLHLDNEPTKVLVDKHGNLLNYTKLRRASSVPPKLTAERTKNMSEVTASIHATYLKR
jgi:hypothetical protein